MAQSLSDMYRAAKGASDSQYEGGDMLGKADLPDGTILKLRVKRMKNGISKNGGRRWSGVSEIIEGGPGEGELWTSITLSPKDTPGALAYNKKCFAKFEALGLDEAFMGADPSDEAVAKACVGKVFQLTVKWQKDSDFDEHQWQAIEVQSAANTAVAGTGFRPAI